MTGALRWGLIGTGGIAAKFAAALQATDSGRAVAVGSRRRASAEAFAERHGIARRHEGYEALVADPEVDAVYVATPHPAHHAAARLALEAGRPTLVEKPFTMDAAQARDLVALARERRVPLLEAMWTRFLARTATVRRLVREGAVGDVRLLVADHCQWFPYDPGHRVFNPALGGGALLDLGIYPVSYASMLLGAPDGVVARSTPAATGVDATTSVLLTYGSGAHAVLTCTLTAAGATRASVVGTEGRIELEGPFYAPGEVLLVRRDGAGERFEHADEGRGMSHEAAELARMVDAGELESPLLPLDETVAVMDVLDEVRRQVGLAYPPG